MKMMFVLPVILVLLSQPFSVSLILTVHTVLMSLYMYMFTKNVLMALTLTLVMVGGLMISFVYVSSLMPAEPYTRVYTWFSPMLLLPFLVLCIKNINIFIVDTLEYTPINMFNTETFFGSLFIMTMLMITLLIVCINTLQVKCPMRSYN